MTNIGNEDGEVVVSVMTVEEGTRGLQQMADGLMQQYKNANQAPPQLLYVDRDCCGPAVRAMFGGKKTFNNPHTLTTLFNTCYTSLYFDLLQNGTIWKLDWIAGIL